MPAQTLTTLTASGDELGGAGLRAFFKLAKIWKLTERQQLGLLGLTNRSTLFASKAKEK